MFTQVQLPAVCALPAGADHGVWYPAVLLLIPGRQCYPALLFAQLHVMPHCNAMAMTNASFDGV